MMYNKKLSGAVSPRPLDLLEHTLETKTCKLAHLVPLNTSVLVLALWTQF
jgi:hypothetical protein